MRTLVLLSLPMVLAIVSTLAIAASDYRSTMKVSDRTWCNTMEPYLGGTNEPDANGMYPPAKWGPTCLAH